MTAMPNIDAAEVDRFSLLEMDPLPMHSAPDEPMVEDVIELDLTDAKSRGCTSCKRDRPVNEQSICQDCYQPAIEPIAASGGFGVDPEDIAPNTPSYQGAGVTALTAELIGIASQGTANATVQGAATSDGGGRLPGVGFRTQDGYITAIRNGVKADTHREYLSILRNQFKLSGSALAKLNLPGPMAETALPEGKGITHTPTEPSIFDRPQAARAFVVGPKVEAQTTIRREITGAELIAGAVAEGHHAIVAWEGTSGMLRGDLVEALKGIGRETWAPSAPNARAQAGAAISALSRGGLRVKSATKGRIANSGLAVNEHVWTVVLDDHVSEVGQKSGDVVARFKLSGATLTYSGDPKACEPVIATFAARMAAEQYKSSDVTSWLSRTIRNRLDGVRFGALGWLVPAANVEAASQLCIAIQGAGFGSGWVTGLPVATSDQLRDGIVRGLVDEVTDAMNRLNAERNEARAARVEFIRNALHGTPPAGDIGEKRAHTYLKEFRAIGERVVAYGQVLGEQRVDSARGWVKRGIAELETIVGEDFSGIRERFGLIWEEIERDRKAAGGVL